MATKRKKHRLANCILMSVCVFKNIVVLQLNYMNLCVCIFQLGLETEN